MSDQPRSLPDRPSLRYLKLEAKRRLAAGEFESLHLAQLAIAREHQQPSWTALKEAIGKVQTQQAATAEANGRAQQASADAALARIPRALNTRASRAPYARVPRAILVPRPVLQNGARDHAPRGHPDPIEKVLTERSPWVEWRARPPGRVAQR